MQPNGNEPLLAEFEAATYEQWREAAEQLLKGKPFDKAMLTPTPEGITLQPIYRQCDLDNAPAAATLPGQDGFTRGAKAEGYLSQAWDIAQELPYGEPAEFNQAALHDMTRGQSALNVLLDIATLKGLDPDAAADGEVGACGLSLASLPDLRRAFMGVLPQAIAIYFQSGCSGLAVHALFRAWLNEQSGINLDDIRGGLGMDPLAVLAASGSLPITPERLYDEMARVALDCTTNLPKFTAAGVSAMPYHCAGASATQELAAMLATGLEYVRAMGSRGLSVDEAASQIRFTTALGPNFFMEVAKLRAARQLWARVVKELGGGEYAQAMKLHARTGLYNKARHDPYANMLRTTTEALSGVIGGADSLCVGAFDEIIRVPNEFSRRVARNTQVILQEECELTAVVDPAGGSWFIESLTQTVAEEAWKLFQGIEAEGGMLKALQSGFVRQSIAKTDGQKRQLAGQRRISLVGVNQYPNLAEKPLEASLPDYAAIRLKRANELASHRLSSDSETDEAVMKQLADVQSSHPGQVVGEVVKAVTAGATLGEVTRALRADAGEGVSIDALPNCRLAELYEELREAADAYRAKNGFGPKIFLANLGKLRRHKLRADFIRAFFETGGFEILYPAGFDTAEDAATAAIESGALITVICGTDDDYVEQVPAVTRAIKTKDASVTVLMAGFPGDHEPAFREAGLDDYIFVKSDNYATNRQYLEQLGVL